MTNKKIRKTAMAAALSVCLTSLPVSVQAGVVTDIPNVEEYTEKENMEKSNQDSEEIHPESEVPKENPKQMPEQPSEGNSELTPEQPPEENSEQLPEQLPEGPSEQIPEEVLPENPKDEENGENIPENHHENDEGQDGQESDNPLENQTEDEELNGQEGEVEEDTSESLSGEMPEIDSSEVVEEEISDEKVKTNEDLVRSQHIVEAPVIEKDFRFVTVEKKYAIAKQNQTMVYESMDTNSRTVGYMNAGYVCFLLEEIGDWYYIESDIVRGFVQKSMIQTGKDVQEHVERMIEEYQVICSEIEELDQQITNMPEEQEEEKGQVNYSVSLDELEEINKEVVKRVLEEMESLKILQKKNYLESQREEKRTIYAIPQMDRLENKALSFSKKTVQETVVDKRYGMASEKLNIYGGKQENNEIIGTLEAGGLCYILADETENMVYVESGDVRGFVNRSQLLQDENVMEKVEQYGESALPKAMEIIKPEENRVLYYTFTSVEKAEGSDVFRESILKFASQFIGNPYVWGGTSLTNGADCSGFVQTIYNQYFGYDLPRVAADQAQYGTKIRVEDAAPGDLIFYATEGEVSHVVIYAGDGRTIEAQSSETGIVHGYVDGSSAVWATRFIDDAAML